MSHLNFLMMFKTKNEFQTEFVRKIDFLNNKVYYWTDLNIEIEKSMDGCFLFQRIKRNDKLYWRLIYL